MLSNGFKKLDAAVSEKLGIKVDEHSSHHSTFVFKGLTVESHKPVMSPDSYTEYEKLDQLLADLAGEGLREVNGVLLSSTKFNSIHLLAHMAGELCFVRYESQTIVGLGNLCFL